MVKIQPAAQQAGLLATSGVMDKGLAKDGIIAGLGPEEWPWGSPPNRSLGMLLIITIILDRPFKIGDFMVTGEISGVIEQIGLKSTTNPKEVAC